VKLRVERDGALVVTAPKRIRRRQIDGFVASQQAWIDDVRDRLSRQRSQRDPAICGLRPTRIELPAVGEAWRVEYGGRDGCIQSNSSAATVHLSHRDADPVIAGRLQNWLKGRARRKLAPWTDALAREHGFDFARLSFRNQKSRWGSCSSNGNLSLNAKLLFCSPGACRYVLLHELVHIEHPDHSPRFWARVAELCPAYRQHMRELKVVWQRLPDWVMAS
jgi:predicted metal-dependent hydrolase